MAKIIISTILYDFSKREWKRVHKVTFDVAEQSAVAAMNAFCVGANTVQMEDPTIYKKHVKFTTEMYIEDDKGNCIGGFKNY